MSYATLLYIGNRHEFWGKAMLYSSWYAKDLIKNWNSWKVYMTVTVLWKWTH